MAKKVKNTFVYLVQADNGEKYAEDRIEYIAGVFISEEAAIEFIKTSGKIHCWSVEIQLWNASINERIGSFELEKYQNGWKRFNFESCSMELV